ncbi:MAG: hypothetical protein DLM68_02120 [Hyphomicrobiales bacterium]|nr:MAG: hypothetical protein DLM68_02120 [Hyphomicrobiales bacterium]
MFDFLTDIFKNRETAELLFWWAGVALAILTVVALIFAGVQAKIIAKQAKATLLLDLVDKFNSKEMFEAKKLFVDTTSKERKGIFSQYSNLPDKEVLTKLKEHLKVVMDGIHNTEDRTNYSTLMRILSFFELVGLLVRRRYISLKDIDELFRGPILEAGTAFARHIKGQNIRRLSL